MSDLIIFDLDGVITSEEAYWDAAGLTLHELVYSPRYWELDRSQLGADGKYHPASAAGESRRISRSIFPESAILAFKARAINSNWDTCYAAACLHLIDLLALLKQHAPEALLHLLPLQPWDATWLANFREQIAFFREDGAGRPQRFLEAPRGRHGLTLSPHPGPLHGVERERRWRGSRRVRGLRSQARARNVGAPLHVLDSPIFQGYIGLELINRFDAHAGEVLGYPVEGVFSRYSPFWDFCRDIFQEWYLGDDLYTRTYGHPPKQPGKPGCIHFEKPLLPPEQVRTTLETLRQQGYVLGFATGRVRQEALYPLKMYDLLKYFAEQHISTYDDVEQAENALREHGEQALLSKPHPFQFLVAAGRHLLENPTGGQAASHGPFIVVGDSTSDILGGHAAGALTVAVLTGARTTEARALLAQSHPDFTIDDMTQLPALLARGDSLATIQRLQFSEREKAERLLQRWFARHMHLQAERVTLTPKAVSLNSFNGFYRAGGEEYFFKTHVEEQGVLQEYYHAELLHQAGYNIVLPLRTLHEEGRQMVIYPLVRWPVMFDLVRAVETGHTQDVTAAMLASAEREECSRLLAIYQSTLAASTAEEHARAPIHQLFWHRLAGERFQSFYAGKRVPLPGGVEVNDIPFDDLLAYRWVINGVPQPLTLGELIERARVVLNPARAAMTITGHGDAHFGNVFLENQGKYLYFDPAFAGRHSPLLDVIKPLFHNVFATWMYFPREVARDLRLSLLARDGTIYVEHNYALTAVRRAILQTKIAHLLAPLITALRAQQALPEDWREIMNSALLCCPLLTINLLDRERVPPVITWQGLSQAVQVGNSGIEPWRNDL